jgi:hypothetical protein
MLVSGSWWTKLTAQVYAITMHPMSHIAPAPIAVYDPRMRRIMSSIIVLAIATPLAGCIVHEHTRSRTVVRENRSCPPAHHWEGGACVHNGKAKGHYK